jgi:ABC-2 type transport system permease protein
MTAQAGRPPIGRIAAVPWWSRVYGFGSVYAKTIRDSRLAFIIVAGLLGGIMLTGLKAIGSSYATAASRQDLLNVIDSIPPAIAGLYNRPVNAVTLGGSVSWKYGPMFGAIAALWSIVALSGTLASEARRGSLDMVAAAPFGKRRIALEKLAAHVTGMAIAVAFLALVTWLGGKASATQPGDDIPILAAVGFAAWVGVIGLAYGSVAWAIAPFAGRASAAGVAGVLLAFGFIVSGYQPYVPALTLPADLSFFYWMAGHLPLAGQYDWLSLVPTIVVAVVLFAVGIVAFDRRDLGSTSAIPLPAMPAALLGVRGPVGRSFGERLPLALAWGLGLGVYGLLIAASSASFASELVKSPDTLDLFRRLFPGHDIGTGAGFLQVLFAYLGFIVAGLAAATLVSGWASDENGRRLEMVMLGIAIGVGAAGGEVFMPVAGAAIVGLYAAAVAGVGMAVGGLVRNTFAGEVTAVLVIATFLVDLLAPALNLPDWVHQLALTAHFGAPLVGIWDPAGVVACLVLAIGGMLIGGWGMTRRDVD